MLASRPIRGARIDEASIAEEYRLDRRYSRCNRESHQRSPRQFNEHRHYDALRLNDASIRRRGTFVADSTLCRDGIDRCEHAPKSRLRARSAPWPEPALLELMSSCPQSGAPNQREIAISQALLTGPIPSSGVVAPSSESISSRHRERRQQPKTPLKTTDPRPESSRADD